MITGKHLVVVSIWLSVAAALLSVGSCHVNDLGKGVMMLDERDIYA